MKVWVNVDRKKAILAGRNEEGWKLVEVDMGKLSQEEREYVAGRDYNRHNSSDYAQEVGGSIAVATEEATIQCIREQSVFLKESVEKKKKEITEKINVILSKTVEEYLYCGYITYNNKSFSGWNYSKYALEVDGKKSTDQRVIGLIEKIEKEVDARNEVIYQDLLKEEAEDKAKEELKAVEKARQDEQIRAWVAERGTENQKKRYEINLLPRSEVIDAIRDEAYTALNDYKRYEKMGASDICTCEEKYDYETGHPTSFEVNFEVRGATEATAEEYAAMEKIAETIKKARPAAVITLMDHVETGDNCENSVTWKSVKVEIEVGTFCFSREYAI